MIPLDLPAWASWLVVVTAIVIPWGAVVWTLAVMWPFIRWSRRMGEEQSATLRNALDAFRNRGSAGKGEDVTDRITGDEPKVGEVPANEAEAYRMSQAISDEDIRRHDAEIKEMWERTWREHGGIDMGGFK